MINIKNSFEWIATTLLALYFLIPGMLKFSTWQQHIEMMQLHQLPMPVLLLFFAAVWEVVAAMLLLTRRYVAFSALSLALLTLFINVGMHDFWNLDGIVRDHEMQNFIKNLAVFAGLLLLSSQHWPKNKHLR
ncbi:DoxX family protein [Psychromonas hadalis]|uniref:DoxX family protein n=1 Tax=Psychromonas hadalis TaxID=211669 RepID=UPI0003B67BF1|nr:DoxX family protein [Psychromonas hadalis]